MRKVKRVKAELVRVEAKEAKLAKVEPIRLYPVEVEVEGKREAPSKLGGALREALKTMAVVFWVVSGFWIAMAILARLLGF